MNTTCLVLDIIVALVLICCACVKGVKGIYKVITPVIVILAAALLATFVSAVLTPAVTEAVYPKAEEKLFAKLEYSTLESLDALAEKCTDVEALTKQVESLLPDTLVPMLKELGISAKDFVVQMLGESQNYVNISDYLTEEQIASIKQAGVTVVDAATTAVKETQQAAQAEGIVFSSIASVTYRLTTLMVHFLLWCVSCIAFLLIITIIKNTFGLVFKLPVIGWVDKAGGALLGIVEAGLVMFCIGWVLRFLGVELLHNLGEGTILYHLFF